MGRPKASQRVKAIALDFIHIITKRAMDGPHVISVNAQFGMKSLHSALLHCLPQITRSGLNVENRQGISEMELNKLLRAEGHAIMKRSQALHMGEASRREWEDLRWADPESDFQDIQNGLKALHRNFAETSPCSLQTLLTFLAMVRQRSTNLNPSTSLPQISGCAQRGTSVAMTHAQDNFNYGNRTVFTQAPKSNPLESTQAFESKRFLPNMGAPSPYLSSDDLKQPELKISTFQSNSVQSKPEQYLGWQSPEKFMSRYTRGPEKPHQEMLNSFPCQSDMKGGTLFPFKVQEHSDAPSLLCGDDHEKFSFTADLPYSERLLARCLTLLQTFSSASLPPHILPPPRGLFEHAGPHPGQPTAVGTLAVPRQTESAPILLPPLRYALDNNNVAPW